MAKRDRIRKLNILVGIILTLLIALLVGHALTYRQAKSQLDSVLPITQWTLEIDGTMQEAALPLYLNVPVPRTSVTLTTEINASQGDYLYIKSVYAPLRVTIDDMLVYEYGDDALFPSFFSDPPTIVDLIPVPETQHPVSLRMEYQSPVSRDVLALHPVILGSSDAILKHLFSQMGFSLCFSVVLLTAGIILILISVLVVQLHKAGFSFFWLGMFSITVGAWFFGECNLTVLFLPNPVLLYLLAFIGLLSFTIPLLRFVLLVLDLKHRKALETLCLILELCMGTALLLQLTGIMQLSTSMYLFHLIQPLSLCILGGYVVADAFYRKNSKSRNFALSMLVLTLFSILEVCNYYVLRITSQMTLFIQIGILLFMIMLILLCSSFVRDALDAQAEKQRLEYENHLMERQIELHKERYSTLTRIDEGIRQQRHDLRHQLIVLRRFAEHQETDKLTEYLDTLTVNIPAPLKHYCKNEAVNAVAAYYAALAEEAEVKDCMITLDIPENTGQVPDHALCIIVGNMLENALEACRELPDGSPFLHMKGRMHNGTLTIILDNSSQPVWYGSDGRFLSRKPGGGTGLRSIATVAERYGGMAQFTYSNNQFSSSVYIRLF